MTSFCPICLSCISCCDSVTTDCGHVFHRSCLRRWLDLGRSVCPSCMGLIRKPLPGDDICVAVTWLTTVIGFVAVTLALAVAAAFQSGEAGSFFVMYFYVMCELVLCLVVGVIVADASGPRNTERTPA